MGKSVLQAVFLMTIPLISIQASADTVMLKSGHSVEGKITDKGKDYVKIDTGVGLSVTYYMDEIASIDGQNILQTFVAVSSPQKPDLISVPAKTDSPSTTQSTVIPNVNNAPMISPPVMPLQTKALDEDKGKLSLPGFRRWVNDYAGVLPVADVQRMNALINELEKKTSAEIAVVTIPSIAPYTEFEYAQMLFDKWKIGKKGKDNGVIVLLAVRERRWRIQTGYGVEGILPDALCSQIGRNLMVPFLKRNEYSLALYNGVTSIARVISKDAGVNLSTISELDRKRQQSGVFVICIFSFFYFLFFVAVNTQSPIFMGLPVTLFFAYLAQRFSPLLALSPILGFVAAILLRYLRWVLSADPKKEAFFKTLLVGSQGNGGRGGRGFGGGGGGSSVGGGGSSGGGGAGGGF